MFTLAELEAAAQRVHAHLPPTPQLNWPLLSRRCGCEVWVKHENHTPIGSFKVRGGIVYVGALRARRPEISGVVCATRGNHGQSVAWAARRFGIAATIVVPEGNSREKNAAMRALGGELQVYGKDFQEAYERAIFLSESRSLHLVRSYHRELVQGVASYALELLEMRPDLDFLYVPIGLGSSISGAITARDALGRHTRIVGVVADSAPCYALSYRKGEPVSTQSSETFADGLAVRVPDPRALEAMLKGVERIVRVTDHEIRAAIRHYFTDTHNLAEGAGAAALAALLKERDGLRGRKVGVLLSGSNIDRDVYRRILEDSDQE